MAPIQTQPYNRIVWPWESGATSALVYDVATALKLPSVGKAIAWYAGLVKQMALNDVKANVIQLPRPPILEQLDPERGNGEVAGLLALMLLIVARRTARVSASGELVTLDEQDRAGERVGAFFEWRERCAGEHSRGSTTASAGA